MRLKNVARASHRWFRQRAVVPSATSRTFYTSPARRHRLVERLCRDEAFDIDDTEELRLVFAASCWPHPDKMKQGGEDSYFACNTSLSFGVADGVGGYASAGVDPGEFARGLMRLSHESICATPAGTEADLTSALQMAVQTLRDSALLGGSTAVLGQLTGTMLSILNLGDSGVLLLRPALRTPPGAERPLLFPRVVFRSSDQTHFFNCPYQLGNSSSSKVKKPDEVPDLIRVQVRPGDIIVAATDGVFDNLFDHQLQAIVARHLADAWRNDESVAPHLGTLAETIARQARHIGEQQDQDVISPFALTAHSEGLSMRGGKLDDTTAVLALVCGPDDVVDAGGSPPFLNNF